MDHAAFVDIFGIPGRQFTGARHSGEGLIEFAARRVRRPRAAVVGRILDRRGRLVRLLFGCLRRRLGTERAPPARLNTGPPW